MAFTNAERQARLREKVKRETYDETERELDKMEKEAQTWLHEMRRRKEIIFRAAHVLLYSLSRHEQKQQELWKALRLIDLTIVHDTYGDHEDDAEGDELA